MGFLANKKILSFRNHYTQMVEGVDAWFKGETPRKLA